MVVTLADPDGDTPISATVTSNVAGDIITGGMLISNGGNRTVQVTFVGNGMHTLSCAPVDSIGGVGAVGTLSLPIVTASTVSITAPTNNSVVAGGSNVAFSASMTVDAAAAPGVLSVVDSIQGPQTLDMSGAGSITAPIQGFHDVIASVADACMSNTTSKVRYAVTPGGAGVASR